MTPPPAEPVKAMVSYAWGPPEHQQRVTTLVDHLIRNGIDVTFDQYDLRDGDDVNRFMEQAAAQGNIQKVIAICDPKYVQKMNDRAGGVGQEGMLMSPHVIDQLRGSGQPEGFRERRFIPVIFTCRPGTLVEDPRNRPTMFGSMKFIDMSTDEAYDANFEQLLRFLLDRPELVRPALGEVPAHLRADAPARLPSQVQFDTLQRRLEREQATKHHWRDYLEQVELALRQLKPATLVDGAWEYDVHIAREEAARFTPVRDQFVRALQLGIRHGGLPMDEVVRFFERVMNLSGQLPDEPQYRRDGYVMRPVLFQHVDFLVLELTLYTTAILIAEDQVDALKALTEHTYFLRQRGDEKAVNFTVLRHISDESHLEHHLGRRWISPVGGWLSERATLQSVDTRALTQADILLYVKSGLEHDWESYDGRWYCTIGNFLELTSYFPLFGRFLSERVIRPWLPLFNSADVPAAQAALRKAFPDQTFGRGLNSRWGTVSMDVLLKLDTWGTRR
ncbi:toll/interleukin-1 receptor domain-containing protein [Deinococcus radiotolerans]|uniref:SEFIR domain-containing protein n=1 Tax=Deinococcus radiotolerans TaxID=1309407 RepID=A0ABQ2FQS2_9DEIO|nr:toll/interleukin-1 receptor domain-containing protein [Deinococcus radiotolerans]GGL17786.1 hypothetical protein GCM10010844_40800 [Deinococcus radiotolerans]